MLIIISSLLVILLIFKIAFKFRNIVNFVKKYGINPVTGDKMDTSELIELNYHKNADGK